MGSLTYLVSLVALVQKHWPYRHRLTEEHLELIMQTGQLIMVLMIGMISFYNPTRVL